MRAAGGRQRRVRVVYGMDIGCFFSEFRTFNPKIEDLFFAGGILAEFFPWNIFEDVFPFFSNFFFRIFFPNFFFQKFFFRKFNPNFEYLNFR